MRSLRIAVLILLVISTALVARADTTLELNVVTFPERRDVKIGFGASSRAPNGTLKTKVRFEEAQARVEIKFERMKPALLFGGNVTCYVVWAISRDGSFENLGELWMPESSGDVQFSTGRKSFAMVITAEAYPLIDRPSELVMFTSVPSDNKHAKSSPFSFSDFAPPAEHDMDSITNIAWDSTVPIDLVQAEKAYELAKRVGAEEYAGAMLRDANITFGQARNLASASKKKQRIDYSRRSIAQSSEAIQTTIRRKEAEELERQIAARKAEMQALDDRARDAELRSAEAGAALASAQIAISEANLLRSESEQAVAIAQAEFAKLSAEQLALQEEQTALTASMLILRAEGEELRAEAEQLRIEREQLFSRLEGALSQVADTRDSARGMIVNLPDILFSTNEAEIKAEAKIVIAKLAGILLVMPELNLRVEGHTDSTGSLAWNETLSQQRALSVESFLSGEGIGHDRMVAVGYGPARPVADNSTKDGRSKNRRVEIIIAEGVVAESE